MNATIALNTLNSQVALQNIQRICPFLATSLINTHRKPTQFFMNGDNLLSNEGTTQSDPLAMPMCALDTVTQMRTLRSKVYET